MKDLEVWTTCHQDEVRKHFQLDESEGLPAALPVKLVLTKKPLLEGARRSICKCRGSRLEFVQGDVSTGSMRKLRGITK